ncbi:Multidrug export protein EmrA [compost metagenome]
MGQPAVVQVDALRGLKLRGHVERLGPATGSEFAVIKPDNATGNFTKVVQRLPTRIVLDPDQEGVARLRPGMSVVARVDTAQR